RLRCSIASNGAGSGVPRAASDPVRRQRSEVREQTSGIRRFFPCRNLTSSPPTIIPGKRLNHFSFGSSKRGPRHKTTRSRAVLQLPAPFFKNTRARLRYSYGAASWVVRDL